MGKGQNAVSFFKKVANPAQGDVGNVHLVVLLRVISMLLVVFTMIVLTLSCILRPWKLNAYKGSQMEIGMWTICRITPKIYQCYDNWYNENPIYWVYIWRAFLMIPIFIQLLTFTYLCFKVSRENKDSSRRHWMFAAIACIFSGLFLFSSLLVFYAKFEWEWAEQKFGWPIMGWNEVTPDLPGYTEPPGYPYIMAWVVEITFFVAAYACFYTKSQEEVYLAYAKLEKQKQSMLQTLETVQY